MSYPNEVRWAVMRDYALGMPVTHIRAKHKIGCTATIRCWARISGTKRRRRGRPLDGEPYIDMDTTAVEIDYTNWREERRMRRIIPHRLMFTSDKWHGNIPQWMIIAFDIEKQEMRNFALSGIHGWKASNVLPDSTLSDARQTLDGADAPGD